MCIHVACIASGTHGNELIKPTAFTNIDKDTRVFQKCFYFAMCRNLDFQKKKGWGGRGREGLVFFLSLMAHTCYPSTWEAEAA